MIFIVQLYPPPPQLHHHLTEHQHYKCTKLSQLHHGCTEWHYSTYRDQDVTQPMHMAVTQRAITMATEMMIFVS